MKIDYIYEAGVFGSYKKVNAKSNIDNAKKDLTKGAQKGILETKCDELAKLYFDMLNEVTINAITICNKYVGNEKHDLLYPGNEKHELLELSNYIAYKYFDLPKAKEMQLNLIKNMYCNRPAIEYMVSQGCFILPLIDRNFMWCHFFNNTKDISSFKNITKTIAEAAEKIIKSYLSKLPSYNLPSYASSIIPTKVKIVLTQSFTSNLHIYISKDEKLLFSYMGITDISTTGSSANDVNFVYPVGEGSSFLDYILDNYSLFEANNRSIFPVKSDEQFWKSMIEPTPWLYNKIVFTYFETNLSTLAADNFYSIKLLKFAVDNGILIKKYVDCIMIYIDDVLKNMQYIKKLKQELSNNGLDKYVSYSFNDTPRYMESFVNIGKKITSEKAEQEGVLIDSLGRGVYEFDYKDATEVESAVKNILKACDKCLTEAGADNRTKQTIKQLAEVKLKKYLPDLMSKISTSKPDCISSSNKILLCDYYKYSEDNNTSIANSNIRVVIDTSKTQFSKNDNLVFCIDFDFKLPVKGVNTNYIGKGKRRNSGKNYEYISGKHIKIEIPL